MEPTHSSPVDPHEEPESGERQSAQPEHQPPFGLRPDPLLAELRLGQYDAIRLEATISLFCADIADAQRTSRADAPPPAQQSFDAEQLVGPIRGFLWQAYDADVPVVRERFETVTEVIRNALAEQLGDDSTLQEYARVALHSVAFSEVASCLTSNNLSAAIRDLDYQVDATLVRPFQHHIEQELDRIASLNRAGKLPPDLLHKAVSARIDQRLQEAQAALTAIDARLNELSRLFLPLTEQAVNEFSGWIPEQSPDYLSDLVDYVRSRFTLPFSQALSDIRTDKQLAITEATNKLEH